MFSSKYDQIWRKFRNPFSKNWYFIKCLAKIIIYFGNCFYIGFSLLQMNKSNGHLVTLSIVLYPFGCPFWQTFNYNGIVVNSATPFTYLALRIGSIQATQNKCFEIEIYVTEIFDGPAFSFRSFKVVKFKIFILRVSARMRPGTKSLSTPFLFSRKNHFHSFVRSFESKNHLDTFSRSRQASEKSHTRFVDIIKT